MNPHPVPRLLDFVTLSALYCCAVWLHVHFGMPPESTPIIAPASAVLTAFLIIFNGRGYYLGLLLVLISQCLAGWVNYPLKESLSAALANIFLACLAYTLLSRARFDRRMSNVSDLSKFVLSVPLIAGCLAAVVDTVFRIEILDLPGNYLDKIALTWLSNALGLMIFTPLLFALWRPDLANTPLVTRPVHSDYLAAIIAVVIVMLLLNAENGRIAGILIGPILLLPVILYTSVRLDLRSTSIVTTFLAMLTVILTTSLSNPLGVTTREDMILAAQEFLLIASLSALGISALMAQTRYRHFSLEQTNKELSHSKHLLELRIENDASLWESALEATERRNFTHKTTRLLNWNGFLDLAAHELDRSTRHKLPVSLISMDIDFFKSVNERYGHKAGDEILNQLGTHISEYIRSCDIAARFGGEEFLVLAPNTDLQQGLVFAERIRKSVEKTMFVAEGHQLRITVSIGVAERRDDENIDKLCLRADKCLDQAKEHGRNCIIHDGSMGEEFTPTHARECHEA